MTPQTEYPHVHVVICGFEHHPLNLQAVDLLVRKFEEVSDRPGTATYFRESADFGPDERQKMLGYQKEYGVLGTFVGGLIGKQGIAINHRTVTHYTRDFGRYSLDSLVQNRVLPADMIAAYYEALQVDELMRRKKNRTFKIDFESALDEDLETVRALSSRVDLLAHKITRFLKLGNLDEAVRITQTVHLILDEESRLRERGIASVIDKNVDSLSKSRHGGVIVCPIGWSHAQPLNDRLSQLSSDTVLIESYHPLEIPVQERDIYNEVSQNGKVSDDTAARLILYQFTVGDLPDFAAKNEVVSQMGRNWGAVSNGISDAIQLLDYQQIEAIIRDAVSGNDHFMPEIYRGQIQPYLR